VSTITAPEDAIDAIIRELARAFNVPISLVSLIESDREFWQQWRAASTTSPWAEVSVHEEVFASDSLLVVEDVSKDDRFAKSPTLLQRGVRFYAGAPLRLKDGRLVGNLGVLDTQPRKLNDAEHDLLASLAGQLMQTLQPSEPAAIG
jgi:GAF domain-containing protein